MTGFVMAMLSNFGIHANKDNEMNFLWANTTTDSLSFISKLSTSTVVKFEGDSIIISDRNSRETLHKDSILSLSHSSQCLSDFEINVIGNVTDSVPISGAMVMLLGKELDDYAGVIQFADSLGNAHFPNLPYGEYEMSVIDRNDNFISLENQTVSHRYQDGCMGILDENLYLPHSLRYSTREEENGSTRIRLDWSIADGVVRGPFKGYEFYVYYDGIQIGRTSDLTYTLTESITGLHYAEIYALSPYGTLTEYVPVEIELKDPFTAVESVKRDEDDGWRYYDMKGVLINSLNPAPGIYVGINGDKRKKIVVK